MRRLILQMGMSLDGFVTSDRQHPGSAVPEDEELVRYKLDLISSMGAHLMGRVTYQEMASHWPHATESRYAAPMNDLPKVVFSTTLTEATWSPTQIARGDLDTEIAELKAQDGPDLIAWGGARFGSALAAHDLIDEYSLAIQPVAVGIGQSLFGQLAAPLSLTLIEARAFACGVVIHRYRSDR